MTGPTPHNKKGQFENVNIRQNITKPFLKALGADPLGQHPLPDTANLNPVPHFRNTVFSAIRKEGYVRGPWFYKGAKLCLYWPVWAGAFPHANWIIVRRDADEIAASCMRTSFMRAFNDEDGWRGWVREHEERFRQMREAGLNIREVWPKKVLDGDIDEFRDMVEVLGLEWNEKAVREFITPELWNAA